jgi:hypothetical protein
MMGRMVTGLMGNLSSQSFLFLGREAKVMGIFVPLKRVDWAGGQSFNSTIRVLLGLGSFDGVRDDCRLRAYLLRSVFR